MLAIKINAALSGVALVVGFCLCWLFLYFCLCWLFLYYSKPELITPIITAIMGAAGGYGMAAKVLHEEADMTDDGPDHQGVVAGNGQEALLRLRTARLDRWNRRFLKIKIPALRTRGVGRA